MKTINDIKVLEEHDIRKTCPSFYAESPHHKVSEKYQMINTREVAVALWREGWMPTLAAETRVRDESRRGVTKHLVRFSHPDMFLDGRKERVELVVRNAHDRASTLEFLLGIFRLVCSNGMVVMTDQLGGARVRHIGSSVRDQVRAALEDVTGAATRVVPQIDRCKVITLTPDEQGIYAQTALEAAYEDRQAPIQAHRLLEARRYADQGNDLWSVYNRVQENILKGGQPGQVLREDRYGRRRYARRTTREVRSIDRNIKINQHLWALTERMAELKAA